MDLIVLILVLICEVSGLSHSEMILQAGCFYCQKANTKYDHLGCVDVCNEEWGSSKASLGNAEMCSNWIEDQIYNKNFLIEA